MEFINELVWDCLKKGVVPNKIIMNMQQFRKLQNFIVDNTLFNLIIEIRQTAVCYVE